MGTPSTLADTGKSMDPVIEFKRALKVQFIKTVFINHMIAEAKLWGVNLIERTCYGSFVRWLIAARSLNPISDEDSDPVISRDPLPDLFIRELRYKTRGQKIDEDAAKERYNHAMTTAIDNALAKHYHFYYVNIVEESVDGDKVRFIATSGKWKQRTLHVSRRRLRSITEDTDVAYCLLQRYTNIGIPGLHYSGQSFYEENGVEFELFASVFNHSTPRYFSLYPDLEAQFGSLGNFYHADLQLLKGIKVIGCNPPFDEYTIHKMIERLKEIIEETGAVIYVLLPHWKDVEWIPVLQSMSKELMTKDQEYVDPYNGDMRTVPCDTIIFKL